jgi:hypothetical protein
MLIDLVYHGAAFTNNCFFNQKLPAILENLQFGACLIYGWIFIKDSQPKMA